MINKSESNCQLIGGEGEIFKLEFEGEVIQIMKEYFTQNFYRGYELLGK